jgi:hypothetical protein
MNGHDANFEHGLEHPLPHYGQTIEWTTIWGECYTVEVWGCACCSTREDVTRDALTVARLAGWTPPRWWQWWRRNDTRVKDPGPGPGGAPASAPEDTA